ncbi:hypothetical protein U1Q18_007049 [Sarracenia purpurea var. burkii]
MKRFSVVPSGDNRDLRRVPMPTSHVGHSQSLIGDGEFGDQYFNGRVVKSCSTKTSVKSSARDNGSEIGKGTANP